MVEVRHGCSDVEHELVHPCHVLVLDVLRLVRHLVIVGVATGGEEDHRYSIPRKVGVIASAVDVLRMPIGVHGVVKAERERLLRAHRLRNVAKFSREAP